MPGPEKVYERADPSLFENIPPELRRVAQWVCWRVLRRPGDRPAKVPVDPTTGREASVTNPATWATYDAAAAAFARSPLLAGIGFVFTAEDPFVGVDVDDCRDPATGELGAWADEILRALDTYVEVSPSGTGVKAFVEAAAPGPATRRNKVELYGHGRYFTVTGNRLARFPATVNARQHELAELYRLIFGAPADAAAPAAARAATPDPKLARVRAIADEKLLDRARAAANGERFKRLFDEGSAADHDGDRSRADAALCAHLAYWTRADAERVDRLFRLSRLLRKKWDERRGAETYGARTVGRAIAAATALFDPDLVAALADARNDVANAEIFVQQHGADFCWVGAWKEWLAWHEPSWAPEAEAEVKLAREDVATELRRRLGGLVGREGIEAAKWALAAGNLRQLNALEELARHRLAVAAAKFDRDPYLLGCANGIVDLRTGERRPGERADWVLRNTGVRFDPAATCPRWDKFLTQVMEGDRELVAYLWRVLGYALTGDTSERAFFILCGAGRNGKTTFAETLQALLSSSGHGYAQKAKVATFLRKNGAQTGANDDIAHLAGARVVLAAEADQHQALDVSLVKELTGSDSIRARHLYGREFQFVPQFKLFIATNHVPAIHESTFSIWDRLHYVAFNWRVPDAEVDRRLPLALLGELEGILARAVAACRDWQAGGLAPPPTVLKARSELYTDMDTFGQFLAECCELGGAARTPHRVLYHAFAAWAKAQGIVRPPSSRALGAYLRERRFAEERGTGNVRRWAGLRLSAAAAGGAEEL